MQSVNLNITCLSIDGFLLYNYTDFGYGACVGKTSLKMKSSQWSLFDWNLTCTFKLVRVKVEFENSRGIPLYYSPNQCERRAIGFHGYHSLSTSVVLACKLIKNQCLRHACDTWTACIVDQLIDRSSVWPCRPTSEAQTIRCMRSFLYKSEHFTKKSWGFLFTFVKNRKRTTRILLLLFHLTFESKTDTILIKQEHVEKY